ncbi:MULTISPECIES: GlxA family transcriptional regulator [unclassified Duganella]|uniref:GlxA family transcriptional regulator n=1 Tax=unclassified Duganella TaxID=2636909 RepID=UPI000891BC05|nr:MULTISPECIES: helix-turn-helix domain-containing protein [unclassified Duganella]SDG14431.1 Transcriptional regulator GlxA family, contains an amidase domain and an AraC-type DNA-binding HTH domain [Duganella sp. OV458]SDJ33683.1 Transcriptional regulator GlxA family, contains an amidase domain and an AraC-type DNA-binding HTH domain [Duganella sp. OV510]
MSFANLSSLAQQQPLRLLLINAGEADALSWAGLVQPLRLAAAQVGREALQLQTMTPAQVVLAQPGWDIALLVADEQQAPLPAEQSRAVIERCRSAQYWGGVGAGVLWLAKAGLMAGVRIALPWALYADTEDITQRAILTPHLFELDGRHLSCCGGAASIDFALTLIEQLFGASVQASIKESLCIERVRGPEERQRMALQARFGALQPRLSEAVTLMETNIEEPLSTDDIANLVGLSRRQLERLFKQYLGSLPSRYYLELRLQRARQLLLDTNHSIVQVGLMCGFSSGSHFSTAFGALFGNTPREERQRKLQS